MGPTVISHEIGGISSLPRPSYVVSNEIHEAGTI